MSGKIILGIDPGTTIMGYGIISVKGENVSLIDFDDLSLKKLDNHYLKLKKIFSSLSLIIEKYNPDVLVLNSFTQIPGKEMVEVTHFNNEGFFTKDELKNTQVQSAFYQHSGTKVVKRNLINNL